MDNSWLVISYTLPREPSRIRVSIWRKLKKTGAVNIQQSLWILPLSQENETVLQKIKAEVFHSDGEAVILYSAVKEDDQALIQDKFNAARNEEYKELLEQCGDFFKEIDKETARENFTFAEMEENEEELNKLNDWFRKIETRDVFGASLKNQSTETLQKCKDVLDEFCDKVYSYRENEEDRG